jgi:hypothetical protein
VERAINDRGLPASSEKRFEPEVGLGRRPAFRHRLATEIVKDQESTVSASG